MLKVAFYINNTNYEVSDFSNPEDGNPGLGGTPYMIVLIATELARRENEIDVTLYTSKEVKFDNHVTGIYGLGLEDAMHDADMGGGKILHF